MTPSDAAVAASAGGAADVQKRVEAAAQDASERSPAIPDRAERAPESEQSGAAERRDSETDGGSESSPPGASHS